MCRSDMASTANSFLTICASKYCQGNTDDIAIAVSTYTAYCDGTGRISGAYGGEHGGEEYRVERESYWLPFILGNSFRYKLPFQR